MAGSPNRLDKRYAFALLDEVIELSQEEFKEIEKAGRCKLDDKQKKEVNLALDSYYRNKKIDQNSSTRGAQIEILKTIKEASGKLDDILSLENHHASRVAQYRITDEFPSVVETYAFELKARWDLAQEVFQKGGLQDSDIIDFEVLANNMLLIHNAAAQALEKMFQEVEHDKGSPNKDCTNEFFSHLNDIYDDTKHTRGGLENFIIECVNKLPNEVKPKIPKKARSLVTRIKKFKTSK